jgi:hypothetical protein
MHAVFRALPTASSSLARVHYRGAAHQYRRPPMPQLHQATRLISIRAVGYLVSAPTSLRVGA